MNRFRLCLVILAAGMLWPVTTGRAQQQPPSPVRLEFTAKDVDASLEGEWFGVYMEGKKIGYFNAGRSKVTEDNRTVYRERAVMGMKLMSAGQKNEITIEETIDFEIKPPFRMVRADYKKVTPQFTETIVLLPKGKGYEATITIGKAIQKKDVDGLDFTLADTFSSEIWLQRKPKKGDKLTTRSLEMEKLQHELSTATILDSKETVLSGIKVTVFDVKSVNHDTNLASESKYDDKGRLLSGKIADIFEMRRESEADAKNTEFSTDIFESALARIDKALGDTASITGLILEIDKAGELLPNGPRQTVEKKDKDTYVVKIGTKYGKSAKATEAEIKDALKETTSYPINDAAVKALAKKAVGEAKTDKEKATLICEFTHNFIRPTLAATVPRMHDLMDRKCGDCKSYALMFTCLCRAAGLPSREVSGFVYMGDRDKAFGGHAWNEVLLDGLWVPVDATMNQVDADPTHILIGNDRDSSGLLKTFGKLKFKLVEVERSK